MSLVKYSCGCVGLLPFEDSGQSIIIECCDSGSDLLDSRYAIHERDMDGKAFTPLSCDDERLLWREIGRLVDDGEQFRLVRSLMRTSST